MEKRKQSLESELLDQIKAMDLAKAMLTEEERQILYEIDMKKESLEKDLDRSLTDDEAEAIEKSVDRGWDTLVKLGKLEEITINQIKRAPRGKIS